MFDSSILDMVILLFFTYFVGSVLLSVAIEFIATTLKIRANQLESNLKEIFFDEQWKNFVAEKIMKSPFYQSLQKNASHRPSYMPAENFAKAILDTLRKDNNVLDMPTLKERIGTSDLPSSLQKVILAYMDTAGDDIAKVQKQIEGFYDNTMDRASGWYKKKIKWISFFTACIIALALNLDTLEIIQKSTKNPGALKVVAETISASLPDIKFDGTTYIFKDKVTGVTDTIELKTIKDTTKNAEPKPTAKHTTQGTATLPTVIDSTQNIDTTKNKEVINIAKGTTNVDTVDNMEKLISQYEALQKVSSQLDNSVFSAGYQSWDDFCEKWKSGDGNIFLKLLGILITVMALQVGSSFWFDTLNKVVNLRSTGKKPLPDDAKPEANPKKA